MHTRHETHMPLSLSWNVELSPSSAHIILHEDQSRLKLGLRTPLQLEC